MQRFWTDHGETIIGILAGAIVGIVTSWYFYWRSKIQKTLDYDVISNVAMLSRGTESLGKSLQVTFEDEPLENPRLMVLQIRNMGKVSIKAEDYDGELE